MAITPPPQPEDPPPKPSAMADDESSIIAELLIRADALETEAMALRIEARRRMVDLARAEEREACARVAEDYSDPCDNAEVGSGIASRIRARSGG